MTEIILLSVIAVVVIVIILEIVQFRRNATVNLPQIQQSFASVETAIKRVELSVGEAIAKDREAASVAARQSHAELNQSLRELREAFEQRCQRLQDDTAAKLEQVRQDALTNSKNQYEETVKALQLVTNKLGELGQVQQSQAATLLTQVGKLIGGTEQKMIGLQAAVEAKLKSSQDNCTQQLEQLRAGLDEKLQGTEKRLGESFQQVNARLEQVRQGIGALAPKS